MNEQPEILSDRNGRKVERTAEECYQSDQSTNNASDSDLLKNKNYETNPFQISDFILRINTLCRFASVQTRKTNPFSSPLWTLLSSFPSVQVLFRAVSSAALGAEDSDCSPQFDLVAPSPTRITGTFTPSQRSYLRSFRVVNRMDSN